MHDNDVPVVLHHYTDTVALQGIVENNAMWATHIRYLNDKQELKYAFDLVQNTAKNLIYKYSDQNSQAFLRNIIEHGSYLVENLDLYVISLTASRDLLSQWRGYGKEYQSACIGFDTSKLKVQSDLDPYNMHFLQRVIYDYDTQVKEITDYLTGVCDILKKHRDDLSNAIYTQLIGLFHLLARMKHESWSEENEWRIVIIPEEYELDSDGELILGSDGIPKFKKLNPKFRHGKFGMIPYLPADLFNGMNGICELILPQSENFENAKTAIAMFFQVNNIWPMKDVNIEKSAIPIVY